MHLWQAVLLGCVQGITEFLPISSSGHLVLLAKLFHLGSESLSFDVFLHAGSLLAVMIVYRKDILQLCKHPLGPWGRRILITTIPTVLIGVLFNDAFEEMFHGGATLGLEFMITGLLLLWAESRSADATLSLPIRSLPYRGAAWIGIAQGAAIMPALSRSGLTLCAALSMGVQREQAVRYSFLVSIPVILGATILESGHLTTLQPADWTPILVGFLASAVSGYVAIRWLLRIIRRSSLRPFAYYVLVIGFLICTDQWVFHRFFS